MYVNKKLVHFFFLNWYIYPKIENWNKDW